MIQIGLDADIGDFPHQSEHRQQKPFPNSSRTQPPQTGKTKQRSKANAGVAESNTPTAQIINTGDSLCPIGVLFSVTERLHLVSA